MIGTPKAFLEMKQQSMHFSVQLLNLRAFLRMPNNFCQHVLKLVQKRADCVCDNKTSLFLFSTVIRFSVYGSELYRRQISKD